MAISFTTSGHEVDFGSDTSLNDLYQITVCQWIYKSSLVDYDRWWQKGYGATGHSSIYFATGTKWGTEWTRATTNLNLYANVSNFSHWGLDKWVYMVSTVDTTGADGDQKLYVGDLDNLAAEPSPYTDRDVGSGTVDSDSGFALIACSRGGASGTLTGICALIAVYNVQLTQRQVWEQQFSLMPIHSSCVLFSHLALDRASTAPDWSGNRNNGTVTGGTVTNHVPLAFRPWPVYETPVDRLVRWMNRALRQDRPVRQLEL